MKDFILVFMGSGLGGLARFSIGKWVHTWHHHYFPFGTFIINVLACLMVGFVIGFADNRQIISPAARVFMAVGFCGGFSTFSTFSSETLTLFQQGHQLSSALYVLGSILFCVSATFAGLFIAEKI